MPFLLIRKDLRNWINLPIYLYRGEYLRGNAMKNKKQFLDAKDVAWILDCSPDDVIEMAKRQKLQETRMGRFWRFRHEAVKAYQRQLRFRGIP